VTHGLADRVGELLQIDAPGSSSAGSVENADIADAGPAVAARAQEERQRLLQYGEELAARGALRWDPVFEAGAILCEELCDDRLALAGA
jgi:hypothetical protein